MKKLVILSGLPGSGKSTFIKENGLEGYTISSDTIRSLYAGLEMNKDGDITISGKYDDIVWKTLYQMLEERMKRSEFVIVDAVHATLDTLSYYRTIQKRYNYDDVIVVDFKDVPLDVAITRDANRESYKQVGEYVIKRLHTKKSDFSNVSWIQVVTPETFIDSVKLTPLDFNGFKKIHHIGDLNGTHKVLRDYLNGRLKDDEMYVFMGDYIGIGIENDELMNFLTMFTTKKNVIFMEGDKDAELRAWANGDAEELSVELTCKKADVRRFMRRVSPVLYYTYADKRVLVTHGGISKFTEDLVKISDIQFINGTGGEETNVDVLFDANVVDIDGFATYQVHGHRNAYDLNTENGRSFNVCGYPETGGDLRVVTLDVNGFETFKIQNDVIDDKNRSIVLNNDTSIEDFVNVLTNNPHISMLDNGNDIYSFNFKTSVFYDKIWTNQTVKARGLHIDIVNHRIVGRSFDKFFNVGEMATTKMDVLENTLVFPVKAHAKENGYLGIVGYDTVRDEFYMSSKASTKNVYAKMLRELFFKTVTDEDAVREFMKEKDVSLVFEVIKVKEDPHMIEYEEDQLILLAVVKNTILYEKLGASDTAEAAKLVGVNVAEVAEVFEDLESLKAWYDDVLKEDPRYPEKKPIEGYVLEDAKGFHVKIKAPFYNYWKMLRGCIEQALLGRSNENKLEGDAFGKAFVAFAVESLKDEPKQNGSRVDVIGLRKMFLEHVKG